MIELRSAILADLAGTYRVCLETGDSGADATNTYQDPDLLGHVYVGPYIAGQRDLARVVVDEAGVAGYVLGAADTRRFEAWCETDWWPQLRDRYPRGTGAGADAELIELLHNPERVADAVVDRYPSHLHIDLLPRAQGHGLGRTLLEGLADQLRDRGSPGVHLVVGADNASAIAFYSHLGYIELHHSPDAITMGLLLT